MSKSRIKLLEIKTRREIPAAPESSVLQTSGNLGWRGIVVELHKLAPMEMPEHFVEGHRLMVAVQTGKAIPFEWKDGGAWRKRLLKPGDFSLQSHGTPNAPRWTDDLEILAVALDQDFVGEIFAEAISPDRIAFRERRCESDNVIARYAAHFKAELENASYQGKLYGESLGMAFALHLLEKHGNFSQKLKVPRGKLASANLRRALEYIHANLAEDLSIEEIAAASFLSAFHFARLFKNTLGLTTHQYVLQTRIERAKRLIVKSPSLNLTEIGLSVGFFDQAHFTKTFKRAVGATPKNFLRQAA